MLNLEKHLENLVRHINLVRDATLLLGKRFIEQGKHDLGRILISKGFVHDASKFSGIEWDYLHAGKDVPQDELELAIKQHVLTNPHHPEYWGGFDNMPVIYVAEMTCDLYARSQEFGTSLKDWILKEGIKKYNIDVDKSQNYKLLMLFVSYLTESMFIDRGNHA